MARGWLHKLHSITLEPVYNIRECFMLLSHTENLQILGNNGYIESFNPIRSGNNHSAKAEATNADT